MKKWIYSALALGLLSSTVWAQTSGATRTPPDPAQMIANRVARLTTLLTLTTDQQTAATAIFTTEQTAVSALMASMQSARTALHTAVQSNDLAGITAAATQIGALTTQQIEAQAKADAAFYALLTPDQQTKYNELRSGGFGHPGHGGPGGPGGPRP